MHQASIATRSPIETSFETKGGKMLPPPCELARIYGSLRIPMPHSRWQVFSNFVSRLYCGVSLSEVGRASGSDISGHSGQDRMVMELLRGVADMVVICESALGVDSRQLWVCSS